MTTQAYKRKLTAILSADVKGYSRLMGEDDEARNEAAEVLRIQPKYTARKGIYKRQEDTERFVAALNKAGLK